MPLIAKVGILQIEIYPFCALFWSLIWAYNVHKIYVLTDGHNDSLTFRTFAFIERASRRASLRSHSSTSSRFRVFIVLESSAVFPAYDGADSSVERLIVDTASYLFISFYKGFTSKDHRGRELVPRPLGRMFKSS